MAIEYGGRSNDVWYEILVALGLSIGAAVSIGFSRFCYALILPAMRTDLEWTYVQAGAMNTANGAGYIVGALLAARFARDWGLSRSFVVGCSVSVLGLLLTAATTNFTALVVLRTILGVANAVTFILGAGLAAAICPTRDVRRRGAMVGLYVAGASVSIIVAGIAIPLILQGGTQRWPAGWIAMGVIGLVGLLPAWLASRQIQEPQGHKSATLKPEEFRHMAPTFFGYGIFGAGYVGYMTFIIAFLRSQGGSDEEVIRFWTVLGLVSATSTLTWGAFLGRLRGGQGPSLVFAMTMLGTLPILIFPGQVALFVSAILFGGSFLAGPTSITIVTQRQLPVQSWTAAISLLTAGFAFGQALGPILGGAISDMTGDISAGLWVSPVLLAIAAIANIWQPSKPLHG